MLEEKLKYARTQKRKKRWALLVVAFAAIIISITLVISISFVDIRDDTAQQAETPQKDDQAVPVESSQKDRMDFLAKLEKYENETEPEIEQSNLAAWNKEAQARITELEDSAISKFGNADYQQALKELDSLSETANGVLRQREQLFEEAYLNAETAFQNDLPEDAKVHIDKALAYKPLSPGAQELAARIQKLAEIAPLLAEARVARAENNIGKEHEIISRILDIQPVREREQNRHAELTRLLRNKAFEQQLAKASISLEKGQAVPARNHFHAAKKIDPSRAELVNFEEKLFALEKEIRTRNFLDNAEAAIREDDWESANAYLRKADNESPHNKQILDKISLSESIISVEKGIDHYLSDPYRLSGDRAKEEAKVVLSDAKELSDHSYSLTGKITRLSELLSKMNNKVAVEIHSDNQTNILVRGVGKVGRTLRKVIYLKPGKYTFEGLREGYRSELINTRVPYDRNSLNITIICDEPI